MVKNPRLTVGARFRWDGSLGFFLGLTMTVVLAPQGATAQAIRTDGRTATTVNTTGSVTDVRTTTVHGGNALNSFSTFNVPAATTTNLHVPTGADRLVNLVRDQRTTVDGMLNAIQNGRVGGNVWFANPFGFVVGAGGVVNVGSLNVSTPTQQFVDNFFTAPYTVNAASLSSLLAGTAPRNAAGEIIIDGKVNAIDGVTLSAGTVNVGGVVYAGARFIGNAPDFRDVVNANGIASANNVLVEGGRIRIVADGDVTVSGTIAAPGAAGVKAGEVDIRAGRDIDVRAGAHITASGAGVNSDGGVVKLLADRNAVNRAGSTLEASAGSSGAGGFVELSAMDTVELAGGAMRADGTGGGAGGLVYVDPLTINVSQHMLRGASSYANGDGITVNGANILLEATNAINVSAGMVISSRSVATPTDVNSHRTGASTGNSGSITLKAANISLGTGAEILSHADGAHNAGAITLDARGDAVFGSTLDLANNSKVVATAVDGTAGRILMQASTITAGSALIDASESGTGTAANVDIEARATSVINAMGYRSAESKVELTNTTVKGKDVNISAKTVVSNEWQGTGNATDAAIQATTLAAQGATQMGLTLAGISFVHSQSIGAATVTINGGTTLTATGAVNLSATNETKAGIDNTPGLPSQSPLGLGAMYMYNQADAKVEVKSGATVNATNLSVRAHNQAEIAGEMEGSADGAKAVSFAVGYTRADVNATARIEAGATINVTDKVDVVATNHNSFSNSSASTAGQGQGGQGMAAVVLALSEHKSSTTAEMLASTTAPKQVNVLSVNRIEKDETIANSKVGQTLTDAIVNGVDRKAVGITDAGQESLIGLLFGEPINAKVKVKESPLRLGGSIAWTNSEATATARIGGNVTATDKIAVGARVIQEGAGVQAHTAAVSNSNKSQTTTDTSQVSVSAGVAIANSKNTAEATVAPSATLTSARIGVAADVITPGKELPSVNITDWASFSQIKKAVEDISSLVDPFSWFNGGASAKSSGTQAGLSGSVNVQNYEVNARAIVDRGASLVLTGSTTGAWDSGVVRVGDTAADDQKFSFDAQAHVRADSDTTMRWLVGKPTLAAGAPVAVGGAYNDVEFKGETVALVREGAVVRGNGSTTEATEQFRLTAESKANLVTVAAVAGAGTTLGLSGTFTGTTANRTTAAVIDNEATVRAAETDVRAKDDTTSWAIGGGLSYAEGASVGIGVATNTMTLTSLAAIADNDTMAGRTSALNLTTGLVSTRDLEVRADTVGHVETIAVAGAAASNSDQQGAFGKLKDKYDQVMMTIASVADSKPTNVSGKKTKNSTNPKYAFTLSGAGSVAINEANIQATAKVEDARIEQFKENTTEPSLKVQAVNQTGVITAAGGGAFTRSTQSGSSPSVGVAGAVAINFLAGGAEAAIRRSTVTGANDVTVNALKGGETLSLGVGLNVDASTGTHSSFQGTGALSLTFFDHDETTGESKNKVRATIEGSTVTGSGTATDRNVDVAAYNRTRLGTGGGALAAGGKGSVGGAVSYADVRQDTEASIQGGSTVSQFDGVAVSAYNSMQIASAAAMVTASAKQDSVSISGSVVLNDVTNNTLAKVENSTVSSTGSVTVRAKDIDTVASLDALFAPTGTEGLDYDGSDLRQHIGDIVGVPGGNSIVAVAGNASFSGGSGKSVGVAVTYNRIQNNLEASVTDSDVTATGGTLDVNADSKSNMLTVAAGVAVAGSMAGTGSATANEFDNKVTAKITASTARTITAKNVKVIATDNSRVDTLAGAVAASMNGSAGGAGLTYNAIDNQVLAQIAGTTAAPLTINATDAVRVEGKNGSFIRSGAVTAAVAGGNFAIGGSVSLNFIGNTTTAQVKDADANLGNNGADKFEVVAQDSATIQTLAGAFTAGIGGNAVGGAISYSKVGDSATASVEKSDVDGAETFTVDARSDGSILSVAVAGGAADNVAVAGSAAASEITNTTRAKLVDSAVTGVATSSQEGDSGTITVSDPSTAATVSAKDTASITTLAGGAAFSGSGAVGLAAAINRIDNTTDAYVSGKKAGSQGAQLKSLLVKAESDESIKAGAAGVAISGQVGVGASTAVNLIGNDTTAHIEGGAQVSADNNVGVVADADDSITLLAGSAGIGIGTVGVGASVAVNHISGTTKAYIDGATTQVDGRGFSDTEKLTVKSGALTSGVDLAAAYDNVTANGGGLGSWGRIDLAGRKADEQVRGVAVNASASHSIEDIVVNVAGGLYAGVGGVTNVNVIAGETSAYVKGARVNRDVSDQNPAHAGQSLSIKASDHSFTNGFAGSLTAGAAGIGGAIETNVLSRTTKAYVEGAANVAGPAGVTVDARSTQGASTYAVGASGGLVALVGTAAASTFESLTHAYISGSTVSGGNLSVTADHDTGMFLASGGVALGGGAGAASVGVALDESVTKAEILNSTVNNTGSVDVKADSTTSINTIVVAGAGSPSLSFAGNAVVTMIKNTTEARISGGTIGSAGSRAGAVTVSATDSVDINARGGAVGIGYSGIGIAAGASVIRIENATRASAENTTIHSAGNVKVESTSDRDALAQALAVGGGGAVGISGAAAVVLSGDAPSSEATSEIDKDGNGTVTKANAISNGDRLSTGSNGNVDSSSNANSLGLRDSDVTAINAAGKKDVKSRVTGASATATTATISGSTVDATGSVAIKATEKNKLDTNAGGGAVGGMVGAGGAVAITDLQSDVRARTTGSNSITSGGEILIQATSQAGSGSQEAVRAQAAQGSGGLVGVGAAVARATSNSLVEASVSNGTTLNRNGGGAASSVSAADTTTVKATARGATLGAVAVGAVVAEAKKTGSTSAIFGQSSTGTGTAIANFGARDLSVIATRSGAVTANSWAGAGGVYAGAGSDARAGDTGTVTASLGGTVNATGGNVLVDAAYTAQSAAKAEGYSGAMYASVGVSQAEAINNLTVSADVDAGSTVNARSLTTKAASLVDPNNPTAKAEAQAGGGAGLVGVGATDAKASHRANVTSEIGNNVTVTLSDAATTGSLAVLATNNSRQYATVNGVTVGGLLALGFNKALAEAGSSTGDRTSTSARIGTGVKGDAGANLVMTATGHDDNYAGAVAGSGGAIAGQAAEARTRNYSSVLTDYQGGTTANPLTPNAADLSAKHTAKFNSSTNSVNAGIVGGSGAYGEHDVDSSVTAQVGDNAVLVVGTDATAINLPLAIKAENVVTKADNGWDVKAASGGVFSGAGAYAESDVTLNTTARIGNSATVRLLGDDDAGRYGHLTLAALNSINATQKAHLDAGGAIAVALADSDFNVVANANAVVGTNATVDSKGDIVMGASTSANVTTESYTSTYGLAGVAKGDSGSIIDTDNTVRIGGGANLRADWNIALQAGQAGTTINNLSATALTNVFNNVAIPITGSPEADAIITQDNQIHIDANAKVRSVRDVYLESTAGTTHVRGHGVAKDLYQQALAAIGSAISNAFGGGDVSFETTGGKSQATATTGVEVNGAVEVGIQNIVNLDISGSGANPTITANSEDVRKRVGQSYQKDLVAAINDDIQRYQTLKTQYAGSPEIVAAFEAEIQRLIADRNAFLGAGVTSKVVWYTPIDNITATGGDIHVKGAKLYGTGTLKAPGNASINITSSSDNYITVGYLKIPDNPGGHLYLNGAPVTSNAEINTRTGGGAGFGSITTGSAGGAPSINITINTPSTSNATPDLEVTDEVRNMGGDIRLSNLDGSIIVKSVTRRDGTQTGARVLGKSVHIDAARDFVLSFVDGFYPVASDPTALWSDLANALVNSYRDASINYAIGASSTNPDNSQEYRTDGRNGVGGIVAGNNVFLNARILNINGLVQAGMPELSVHLDNNAGSRGTGSVEQQIANANADYNSRRPSEYYYALTGVKLYGTGTSEKLIDAVWNAKDQRIEIKPVALEGSYMQLTGRIINTGGGKLSTIDGYGKIYVKNDTQHAIVLQGLDAGNNLEGVIRITDTSKKASDGSGRFITTEFRRSGANIVKKEFVGDTEISSTTITNTRDTAYNPAEGYRFGWTAGQQQIIERERVTYTTKGCYGVGGDGCAKDDGSDYWRGGYYNVPGTTVNFQTGGYLEYDPGSANQAFKYNFDYRDTSGFGVNRNYNTDRHGCGAYWCYESVDVYRRTGQDFHRFSVKADYPIQINFTGYDTSEVKVQSIGSILLGQGTIASRNGGIEMSSTQGSIQGLSNGTAGVDTSQSTLLARTHNLSARDGIGKAGSAITLEQIGTGSITATSTNKDIALRSTSGDLTINNVNAGLGNVHLTAERNLVSVATGADSTTRVTGQDVFLAAVNGTIGTDTTALNLQVGAVNESSKASGGLSASAAGNINVQQMSGNLYLNSVESKAGDVTITVANGSLYDWNKSETADNRTIDELRAWWNSLGLTGANASAKVVANEASYKKAKETEYQSYWQVRNVRPKLDANGVIIPGQYEADSFDPASYHYVASAQERAGLAAAGWDEARITQYETDRTNQIKTAHSTWGSGAYNPGFSYAVSETESRDLAKGGTWTESQLRYSMSLGAIRTTGDTTAQIEKANVVGRHVTLNAVNGSVGKSAGTVVLDANNAGNFTDAQKIAAAGAERDDITVDNINNKVVIDVKDDVDVDFRAGGSITINAKNEVYLGSEGALDGGSGDINVKSITSSQGDIRIKVAKGIKDVQTGANTAAISGRNLLVEGGSGGIGTQAAPLKLDLQDGYKVTARATGDVYLKELTGNMNVSSVFSTGTASLIAAGSIIDGLNDGTLKVKVGSLVLDAGGAIGSAANAFEIDTTGGSLVATSRNGGVYIDNLASAPMVVDDVSVTGGDLQLRGGATGLDVRGALSVANGGAASLSTTAGSVEFLATGSLDSNAGAISITAPTLEMAEGSRIRSQTGTIAITTEGDMFLSHVETGNNTGSAITATSTAGRILEAGTDAAADIVANGASAMVTLNAAGGIGNATRTGASTADGTTPNALETRVGGLSATSSGGAIHLSEQDGLNSASVSAHGALDLDVAGALTAASLSSATSSVDVSAQGANITTTTAATDVRLAATAGNLATGTVTATNGLAQLSATGTLTAGTTTAKGDVLVTSGGNLSAGTTTSQDGTLTMTSTGGSLTVGTSADSQGLMKLTGQTGVTTAALTTDAGSIDVTANTGDLSATSTDAADAVTLKATTGNVKVDVIEAQNAVSITAGQSIGGLGAVGTRYTRVESLGGSVTMTAQGGNAMGNLTRARNDVTLTASNGADLTDTQALDGALAVTAQTGAITIGSANAQGLMKLTGQTGITATSLTTDAGSIEATANTGDVVITTADAADAATLNATTGHVKLDVVEARNAVAVTAGQSIGGVGASGSRYGRVESLGGSVTMTAQGGNVTGNLTRARNDATLTASNGADLTDTQALDGALAVTAQTGAITIGSANAQGLMKLQAQAGITGTSLATDAGSIDATTTTGDLTVSSTDSAAAVTFTAVADNVKVGTVEAQNNVTVTAGKSIGGLAAGTRYASIESLAGDVSLEAQGGNVTGTTTKADGMAQVVASATVDLTNTTTTNGTLGLTATAGDVKVDTVVGQGDVTITAGQSVLGSAAPRYVRVESLGGDVTITATTGGVTGNQTLAKGDVSLLAGNGLDLTDTQALDGALTVTAQTGAITIGSAHAQGLMKLAGQTGITATSLTTDAGSIEATATTGDLAVTTTDSAAAVKFDATADNVKVGTVEAQNNLTVTAGKSIGGLAAGTRYTSVESLAGDVSLEAKGGNVTGTTTKANGSAQVLASATVDLTDTRTITGTLGLTATAGDVKVDTVIGQGNVTVTAGQSILGSALPRYDRVESLAGNATMTAQGGDITGNATTAHGSAQLTASDNLDLTTTRTTAGTLGLTATAGDVKVDTVIGQGNVTVTAGQSILGSAAPRYDRIESLGGSVTMTAQGGDITGNLTRARNDVTLTASNGLDLTDTQAQDGALTATAQTGAIAIGSANAQGLMKLQAQTDITATNLTTDAGSIDATASTGDVVITSADAADAMALKATAGNVKLDTAEATNDLSVTASQSIVGRSAARYGRIESLAGNVALLAQNDDVTGNLTRAAGSVQITARDSADLTATQATNGSLAVTAQTGSITIDTANAQTLMTLNGQAGITATTLTTDGGSLVAAAHTGDVTIRTADSADAVVLTATTGNVKVDTVQGQNDVTVTAALDIAGTPGARYTRIESLAGNVYLNARGGSITGNLTQATGNVQLLAGNAIDATTTTSTGASIIATTGTGTLKLDTATAQRDALLTSGADILVGDVLALTGNATLRAQDDIRGNMVDAAQGDASLDSVDGGIHVSRIRGGGVLLFAKDAIVGDLFEVGRRLVLVSDSVDASILHTQPSPMLKATLIGRYQPVMSNVKLTLNSQSGVSFDRFWATNGALLAQTGAVELVDGYIGNRLTVVNPFTSILMDNNTPAVQVPWDVQLFSRTKSFRLFVEGNVFDTQGSDIVHRSVLSHTVTSLTTDLDSSVAETSMDEAVRAVQRIQPPLPPVIQPGGAVVQFTGTPVLMPDLGPQPEKKDSEGGE
jgi:filamentous hemagglutinin family protein